MILNYQGNDRQDGRLNMVEVFKGVWKPALKEVSQDNILARQDLNRQLRYNSNARIWAKQAELSRKGKTHHAKRKAA